MPEWWTYGLSDFLLFSPRTYYRLIERHNAAVWPAQLVTLGLGLGILWMLGRPAAARGRVIAGLLAPLWAWVAWAFVWRRYAGINWAASYFVWLYAVEVVLLVWIGVVRGELSLRRGRDATWMIGIAVFGISLLIYPAIAMLAGRGWRQAEIFGVAPDPTVLATLGVLLVTTSRVRWALLAPPIVLCGISAATLWAMESPEAWLMLTGLVLAGVALRPGSPSPR